ncbi:MAG: hypothetical protein QGG83_04890 [Candidatus Woesearchaeota archaeon]|nr:hypothetical protein [Candidatus Woesearchaeota archaeon]
MLPIINLAGPELRDCQLPEEGAIFFVEAHENPAVSHDGRLPGGAVVCAYENLPRLIEGYLHPDIYKLDSNIVTPHAN